MRSVSITPQADDDVFEAFRWYEKQTAGLGDVFYQAFNSRVDSICDAPDQYESLGGGYRRALLGRFPYSVVFEASPSRVIVHAVPHNHRDEWAWRRRLKPR